MRKLLFSATAATVLASCPLYAQDVVALMKDPSVQAALNAIKRNEPETLAEQARICEIPAPPFQEEARGREFERLFRKLGLHDVLVDKVGNVIGTRPGSSSRPRLVVAAHLDTVFPKGTDVRVSREGSRLKGPGIGDDCRGLAVILAMVRAMDEAGVRTTGPITFVANVGEEGLGDLRGAKHLFHESLKDKIDAFISIDGTGPAITNVGVGSMRYRVTFKGPGGHSFGAFGNANPIHALGRAVARISEFQVPDQPKTTFNVGRIGGGTSVNSIPFEAWMEVDMRSSDSVSLNALNSNFQQAINSAVAEENLRWNDKGKVSVSAELVGLRPAGVTDSGSALVRTAIQANEALGLPVILREGSTDANVGMSLSVPAITIGGGGAGAGAHSLNEVFDSTDSWQGSQRALLLAIALTQ